MGNACEGERDVLDCSDGGDADMALPNTEADGVSDVDMGFCADDEVDDSADHEADAETDVDADSGFD